MIATWPQAGAHVFSTSSESAMPKRRWLEVVSHTDSRYGGVSAAVPAMAASLASGYPIDVSLAAFCHAGEEHRPAQMQAEQISFWSTSRKRWVLDRALRTSFMNAVAQSDALHVHGIWEQSTAMACRMARQSNKPYVLSSHGMLEPWALAAKRVKKSIYAALIERENVAGAACLHALTQAEAGQYRNFGAKCPIAVIPNAVDLPQVADPALFFQRFPELRGKRIVLFLSRLHPKKGLDLLVEAWGRIARNHANAHLVIAGPDADGMQAHLETDVFQRGLIDCVTFTGMLTGAMKWSALAAAECYVLPSYSEGLSMALLEAMGMGLPVIATRACNMPEISIAQAGWEIDTKIDALTSALSEALSRPSEQNWLQGQNGAGLIASRYSPTQVTRAMAEIYEFVVSGAQPQNVQLLMGDAR